MANPASNDYTGPRPAPDQPTGTTTATSGDGQDSTKVFALARHLFDDLATLLRKELALAASEVNHAVKGTKKGIAGLVSGAVVLNSGFIFLLAAATLGLAEVMEPWLAALIVGVVVTVIGLIMVQAGKKKLEPANLRPDRTMEELRKDRDSVKGATS